jgi:hypothetical protein
MASFNTKKYLPFLIILGAFFLIALFFSFPALTGKVLTQGDNISWKGMSHEASEEYAKTGEPVLWSNSMFGGMPTYTFFVGKTANYISYIETTIQAILPKPAYFFFIAMVCAFLLMRVLGVNRWLAGIGAIAYAFSTYNPVIISAGHETKMLAMGYMPGVMAGILLIYRGRWLAGMATAGILFALMFQNQHFQIVMYMGIMLIGMFFCLLYLAIREGWIKRFLIATLLTGVTLGLGAGPSLPLFMSSLEYSKHTMRGGQSELTINHDPAKKSGGLDKDYAFRWSSGIGETFCLLVPYLYGGASGEDASHAPATAEATGGQADRLPTYWGPQISLSGPVYFGAVICFLFVLGMLVIRSPHKWWMAAVSLLAIMMSWGNNFTALNYFIFDHVPYFNVFRTPSMVMVIPQLLFPVIAVWGIQDILMDYSSEEAKKKLWKNVKLAAIVTGGLALILGVGGSMFFDFTDPIKDAQYKDLVNYLKEDRAAMARNSGLLSAFYIAAAAAMVWAFLKSKMSSKALMAGLAVLVCVDLIPTAWRYLNERNYSDPEEYEANFTPRPADQQVLEMGKGDPYYRVLDVSRDPYNDAEQAYFHKCVGGYSPAKMEIYQDLIDIHMNGRKYNAQVLNMLNTRFIIVPGQQNSAQVLPNPEACGNAWFVSNIKSVNTADEEILALKAPSIGDTMLPQPGDFNARETAVVRNAFGADLKGLTPHKDSASFVKLKKYGLNEISYTSSNSAEGLAVFSDIWYPLGWKAYVDGKETPIVRANYVLRALRLPAGPHEIVFKFHPQKFYTGNTVAGITSFLLIAILISSIVMWFKKEKKEEENVA